MVSDRSSALDYSHKALDLDPKNGEMLFLTAVMYNQFGQTAPAISYLKKAVDAGYSKPIVKDSAGTREPSQNAATAGIGWKYKEVTSPHDET